MARSRFIVGIDLGTTNCAVAFVDTGARGTGTGPIRTFEVDQLVAAGEVQSRPTLPSFLYLPAGPELPPDALRLPWDKAAPNLVGDLARTQGARVPNRLVASAKSWLCHPGVDRQAEILPWGATEDVDKVSPVDASTAYLSHIRASWNHRMAQDDSERALEHQEIVLTVPASFDEVARELTVEAARNAGFEHLTLLEEPQAAFYCWIVNHEGSWQSQLNAGERILVCDIGGGTTDFSLITVVETDSGPGFKRVAVGDHLMLGGDNIDLALAHRVESRVSRAQLDTEQWNALRLACRVAKEKLLADPSLERWPVTVAGRGSKLIGGAIRSEVTQEDLREIVLDGFFPITEPDERPESAELAGLQEFGLPYVNDPAIPRHLAEFLDHARRSEIAESIGSDDPSTNHEPPPIRPEAILFNGGAMTPGVLRERIVSILQHWSGVETYQPRTLINSSLDLAVSIGAAYYGVVRRGGGIRIGGGTARAYYVGVAGQSEDHDHPWLCVVPRDAQEGDEIAIEGHDFELLMGQPVLFPLASSSIRSRDRSGDLIADDRETLRPLPPLQSLMKTGRKAKVDRIPVSLQARVTEVGTLELWCQSRSDPRRWNLQIQVRETGRSSGAAFAAELAPGEGDAILEASLLETAGASIRTAFQPAPPKKSTDATDEASSVTPAGLVKRLEVDLESPRAAWPPSALRQLWAELQSLAERRMLSPQHESRWLNLVGYCLRPGAGYPLDEVRIKQIWSLLSTGVHHAKEAQVWTESWILWRRVAVGLNLSQQQELERRLSPLIDPQEAAAKAKRAGRSAPGNHELGEIWRCLSSLERLTPTRKRMLGNRLVDQLVEANRPPYAIWCLGRLGARVMLYGPANAVVSQNAASTWLEALLTLENLSDRERSDLSLALVQIARVSGDRTFDLDGALRERAGATLADLGVDEGVREAVQSYQPLQTAQQGAALGDALPIGLRLADAGSSTPHR